MNETTFKFGGVEFVVSYGYETAEPDTFDCPGHPEDFWIESIRFPDGQEDGMERFSVETIEWIEDEVKKQLASEAAYNREEAAVERYYNREEWSHARRPQP